MLKNTLLLIFSFCVMAPTVGQNFNGVLLDAGSQLPVPNGEIRSSGLNEVFYSNSEGEFFLEIKNFPETLLISRNGYLPVSYKVEKPEKNRVIYLVPKPKALSEVVIRSTIIPSDLLNIPAAVNLITPSILLRNDGTNLMNAFFAVPGIHVHQGAMNTNRITIRGIGSRAQYGTNRIKVYYDGIPLTSGEGETTIDDIDVDAIERIEVIKGPTSSLYGAGLGGVLNIYSPQTLREGTQIALKNTFGSFGLWKKTAKVNHGAENHQFFTSYNHLSSDGFRENGEYGRKSFALSGKLDGGENELSFLLNLTRLLAYIPSSITREQMEEDPSAAAPSWNASKGYESYDKGNFGLSYQHQFTERLENTTSAFMNFRNGFEPRPFDILKEDQMAIGGRTKFIFQTPLLGLHSKMSVGAEYYREWYNVNLFENLYEESLKGSVAGNSLGNNSQDRDYFNFFGQMNLYLSSRLKVEGGLNINKTRYQLEDYFYEDGIDQSGSYGFETVYSPRISAVYQLTKGKSLYSSWGKGFSTPSVAETLTPEGLINTDLQPETGVNREIGFKGNWMSNRIYTELVLYSVQVKNLLIAERIGEDQYIGKNLGKTEHNGIELLVQSNFELSPEIEIKPYFNASFNFYEFKDFNNAENDFSGNDLPGVPERTINAGLDLLLFKKLSFFFQYRHVGEMALNDANSLFNESYNLLDLKTSYTLAFLMGIEAEITFGCNNILNERYASSILPNAMGFGGASPRYFYPGVPRNFFGGIGVNYSF